METKELLRVDRVRKFFPVKEGLLFGKTVGHVKAVDDVSFSIPEGKTLALVGESGCGKTTIAKMVLWLEKPTDGLVLLDGENVHKMKGEAYRSYRSSVQAVFQDPWSSVNPRMRVHEIVSEPLIVRGGIAKAEISNRVEQALLDVGLQRIHANRYPHEFSGGQRQRISVARAIVSEPRIIILDEPVSALDVSIRAQIMNLLKDLQKKNSISYLLIAHDLATARYMADEIAVMYLGKLVEHGETEELFKNRRHPYTQALFSAALPSHPDWKHEEEIILSGEVPSPIDPPSGCPFHPRCPKVIGPVCEKDVPELQNHGSERACVACHLY